MYSQHEEERVIASIVPDSGRFLDVGGFHPKQLSNTRALFERGWGGVIVEPSPAPLRTLIQEYGGGEHVTVIGAAVGYSGGLIQMHCTDGPVSTHDKAIREVWESEQSSAGQPYFGKWFVPEITFEQIINQFGSFDFVNIDTEGSSVDLLHRLLAIPMDPKCICVEHDGRASEVHGLMFDRGYKIAWGNGTNLILTK